MNHQKNAVRSIPFILLAMLLLSWLLMAQSQKATEKHPEVDFSISCMECHQEETPDITQAWKQSKHGMMNFGCYMCHGDGEMEFYAKPNSERCIGCHGAYVSQLNTSQFKSCFVCHNGHNLKFHKSEK